MPTGFRGNPAAGYLQRVERALDPARVAHRRDPFSSLSNRAVPPPSLPARPNQTEPFPSSTARSGGHSTGFRSSNNVVASNGEYASLATRIMQVDNQASASFTKIASGLEQVLSTSYVMPQASPRCQSGITRIRSSFATFRALGQSKSSRARTLGQNITNIG